MSQLFLIFGSHASLVDFLDGYYCFRAASFSAIVVFPGENEKTFLTAQDKIRQRIAVLYIHYSGTH